MKELKIQPIKDGTVIDHIAPGNALKVLHILGLTEDQADFVISVAINVKGKNTKKDIVKIENRELDTKEVDKIALIAPDATINIIRDYEVADKHRVSIPKLIQGIVKCSNPNCISNSQEPIVTKFILKKNKPLRIRCYYCDREPETIASQIL